MTSTEDTNDHLTVLVTPGRWDVFDYTTPRKILLMQFLTEMGGVNESAPPGTYHFNVELVDGIHIATLDPA